MRKDLATRTVNFLPGDGVAVPGATVCLKEPEEAMSDALQAALEGSLIYGRC